jgi:predicted O-linked N-acetylglucosamine transferase (SPINDLY family)
VESNDITNPDQLLARGNELEDKGQYAAALQCYEQAGREAPTYPRPLINVGNVLRRLGCSDEAEKFYKAAIELSPEYAPAHFNLGSFLGSRGRNHDAEYHLREALRLEPSMVEAAVVLAVVMQASHRWDEAETTLRRALDVRPDFALAALNLGQLLIEQARYEEAVPLIERSVAIAPEALSWALFLMNNRADLSAARIHGIHVKVGAAISKIAGPPYVAWTNRPDPNKRLKVGYVSGDFSLHPVGLLMKPVLANHDPSAFDVHCFSNTKAMDSMAQLLCELAPKWYSIVGLSDDDFSGLVRKEEIDILVDLSGHTNRNRLQAFARHPAPVQVTWLGYLNTTGLATIDYRVCDRYTDPAGVTEAWSTETLFRMPHSQWCYVPWTDANPTPDDQRSHESLLFGSVNRSRKITDACLDLWCPILEAVPAAKLLILDVQEEERRSLLRRFHQRNIDSARLMLAPRQSIETYYTTLASLDVALDTLPYNGATTTLDTLWMGTPIVALRGERGLSRGSYSILSSAGLTELIAETPQEYMKINLRLAEDRVWRSKLRTSLRRRLTESPLMDSAGFVRALEAGYREMWKTWCQSPRGSD